MDFSFSSEQEDLRREARAFLEAEPVADAWTSSRELGWVGILQGEDFTFLDAAVLFEELGRVLYDGPYVLNEVAGQPGDESGRSRSTASCRTSIRCSASSTPDMQGEPRAG